MNVFKKLISLNYRKEILPFQILKKPQKILVLLPVEVYELSPFIPAIKLLRENFKTAKIIGVVKEEEVLFFKRTGLFNQIITYLSTPRFMSRQFYRLREKLRNEAASMSIDFNSTSDLLSWLGGAHLRIGRQTSPFINYKVKLSENEPDKAAIKLVKAICMGH